MLIYETLNYNNYPWDGPDFSGGAYYYLIELSEGKKIMGTLDAFTF